MKDYQMFFLKHYFKEIYHLIVPGPKEILDNGMGGELFKMKDFTSLAKKIALQKKFFF